MDCRNRCKRGRTPVALLRSLSGKYSWERYEPPYPPSYGLNSITTRGCPRGVMVKAMDCRNRCKLVRILVALLRSLSGKYSWERYEPPYPSSYGLNSITIRGCPRGVMVKAMDCRNRCKLVRILVALLRSLSGKYSWKGMNPLILPAMG